MSSGEWPGRRGTRDLDFFNLSAIAASGSKPRWTWGRMQSSFRQNGAGGYSSVEERGAAVDNVMALFGRAEARHFIDLMAIGGQCDLGRLFTLAAEEDRGFDPRVFADI